MKTTHIEPDTLLRFKELLNINASSLPSTRVQYSIDQGKPIINQGIIKNSTSVDYSEQNTHTIHVLETAIVQDQNPEEHRKAALMYLARLSVGSGPLTIGDLACVFSLLNASDKVDIDRYLFLQGLADVISADPNFITVIQSQDPKDIKAKATSFMTKQVQPTESIKDGKITKTYSTLNVASAVAAKAVVPLALTLKCLELCDKSEVLIGNSIIKDLSQVVKSPIAHLMASVLHAEAWSKSFRTAFSATIKLVSSAVNIGLNPAGGKFIPGIKMPGSGLIQAAPAPAYDSNLPFYEVPLIWGKSQLNSARIYKTTRTVVTAAAQLAPKALEAAELMKAGESMDFVPPIFTIRKDYTEGMDGTFLPPGEAKTYNFFDKKLVLSLLAYLSVPISLEIKDDGSDASAFLKARVAFKNILGSYADEDCARPISYGMTAQEYIAERLHYKTTRQLDSISTQVKAEDLTQKRPISFLRLLCVSSGLVSNDLSDDAKKLGMNNVWDGLSLGQPGKGFKSQALGKNMQGFGPKLTAEGFAQRDKKIWRHPQEDQFETFTEQETSGTGIAKSYLCRPFISDEFLHAAIKTSPQINRFRIYQALPSFSDLKLSVVLKTRWRRDKEQKKCAEVNCNQELSKWNRHHCRLCGLIFCVSHVKKLGGVFLSKDGIKKAKSDTNLKGSSGVGYFDISRQYICSECSSSEHQKLVSIPLDAAPLSSGTSCVRPYLSQFYKLNED